MLGDGTSQRDRIPAVLADGFANVDDMAFPDLLGLATEYAQNLRFFNRENEPEGDWEGFFTADEAVIIALILTTDTRAIQAEFFDNIDRNISSFGDGYDLSRIPSYSLAKRMDFWLGRTISSDSAVGRTLAKRITDLIDGNLRNELASLEYFLTQFYPAWGQSFRQGFSAYWFAGVNGNAANLSVPAPSAGRELLERFLSLNFHAFDNAVASLKASAERILPSSFESGSHSPATALFITFTQLFKHAQKELNRFPARRLDFYYDDVLKIQRRQSVPDSAYLIVSPDVTDREVLIKGGTEFLAEMEENDQPLIYTSDNDLLVHGAKVSSLATLHFERDPYKSPEVELGYYSGARVNHIPVLSAPASLNTTDPKAWPVFGAPKIDDEEQRFEEAEIGFAVASSVLFLKEGDRHITFSFTLEHRDPETGQVTGADEFFDGFLDQLAGSSRQEAFYHAFREMFTIDLTGEGGWYRVPSYLPLNLVVDDEGEKDVLKIEILLPPDVEPVVPYSQDTHGGGYDCELPVARFMVNPAAYLYPYSLLKDIAFRQIEIETDVKGVREVILHNNLGQLDSTGPFNPFGPIPISGSYLIVGNPEIARKDITHFDMNIEWGDLPTEGLGFVDHYQGYGLRFENSVFQARVTVLRDGNWLPQDEREQPMVGLFTPSDAEGAEEGWNGIRYNRFSVGSDLARNFKAVETATGDDPLTYSTLTKNGFFRFTLANPHYAFGHKEYPVRLTNVLTANAQLEEPELFAPTPNPPYTPLINSVSIDYRAIAIIDLQQITSANEALFKEKIFHIHPFGLETLSPARQRTVNLLPQFDASGNLYIGISADSLKGALSLFFHLREDCAPEAGTGDTEITWHYLSSNRWVQLDRANVMSDSTNGFLSSGIVVLEIPEEIDRGNTVMPGDLFWLRASAYQLTEAFCSIFSVHAQALRVSWQRRDDTVGRSNKILPAGTIKAARVSIPGIGRVDQIVDSFGGSLPETAQEVKVRTSERLRHKNRALTPWDYERLILQRFPEIFKVKCFPNMVSDLDPEQRTRPGSVLVVVISNPRDHRARHLKPMVNGLELEEIRRFVNDHSSPFATIEVRNPAYEQVQIRCTVKFHPGSGEGYHLNALNQAITDYISPWNETVGYNAEFGWNIRRYEIESFIRNLDYIDFVTNFSMLHIADNSQGYFHLFDTMKGELESTEVYPYYPWSIAIPVRRHAIEVTDQFNAIEAEITGVDELEIGTTFILSDE